MKSFGAFALLLIPFSLALWVLTALSLSHIAEVGGGRGYLGSFLDSLTFAAIFLFICAILKVFGVQPSIISAISAALVWILGDFALKFGLLRGDNFSFYEYGHTTISNGALTEQGKLLYISLLGAKSITFLVFAVAVTLYQSLRRASK